MKSLAEYGCIPEQIYLFGVPSKKKLKIYFFKNEQQRIYRSQ